MDTSLSAQRFCLYNHDQLAFVIDHMADQAAPLLARGQSPLILGILRRGAPLARMLQQSLATRHGLDLPCFDIKVKRYGDDLTLLHPDTALTETADLTARDLHDATVLVVDDVLYQGHSLARVLAYLSDRGVAEIRVAVLVDRCLARLPVQADIVGVRLQIAPSDVIECNVPPYEPDFKIEVLRRA